MGKYFGTDGIRGIAGSELDPLLALRTGQAVGIALSKGKAKRPVITIGKDTRVSSDMLESALVAGICSAGADVRLLGVVPTPAVAFLTLQFKADAGIVISASHNPFEYNGIKIFSAEGFKLSDDLEAEIEVLIDEPDPLPMKTHNEIGKVYHVDAEALSVYIDYLYTRAESEIKGLKVAIDCANGAASSTASNLFSRFNIDCEIINERPNGVNINAGCGSTHMDGLCSVVKAGGFDLGLAFDGDADRCLAVDEKGNIIDGDKVMGICGKYMKKAGRLAGNAIVATVMSNLGFHEFARKCGIDLRCAAVGDRNVLELMQAGGYNLGGEQSGHLIFLDDATTGDGQLAAVKFLSILSSSGLTASQLASEIPQYPQVLHNLPIEGGNAVKSAIMSAPELAARIVGEQEKLGGEGRILVRPSGTEALIRVMVEARSVEIAEETAAKLINLIKTL